MWPSHERNTNYAIAPQLEVDLFLLGFGRTLQRKKRRFFPLSLPLLGRYHKTPRKVWVLWCWLFLFPNKKNCEVLVLQTIFE